MTEKISIGIIAIGLFLVPVAFFISDPLGILFGVYVIGAVPVVLTAVLTLFFARKKRTTSAMDTLPADASFPLRVVKWVVLCGTITLILIFGVLGFFVIRGW